MRLKTLENQMRVYMNPHDYHIMVESAPTRRSRLTMKLMGRCSCRIAECVDAGCSPRRSTNPDVDLWFLPILGKDTRDRDTDGKRRDVWVPQDVKADIDQFCDDENRSEDDPLFHAVKRTLQRDVEKAAENAARRTGNEDFKHVSCHDFRAYFATNMLLRKGVDVDVVMELGGWDDRQSMDPYLNASFDDIIQDALAQAGVIDSDTGPKSDLEKLREEVAQLREAIENLSAARVERSSGDQTGLGEWSDGTA